MPSRVWPVVLLLCLSEYGLAFGQGAATGLEYSQMLSAMSLQSSALSVDAIKNILPHRYPFLLVDRVLSLEPGKSAVGLKQVSANEEFFQGHFPGMPIMPGVLQVEALAQLGGLAALSSEKEASGKVFLFAGVDGVKWRKPVVPGDTLILEVEVSQGRSRGGIVRCSGKGYVAGQLVVEVKQMTFALPKKV